MNKNIEEKIQKLLIMAERGGTENEMQVAMRMVQELLAKHNLEMSDVQKTEIEDEDIIQEKNDIDNNVPWQRNIYYSIGRLYFCKVYSSYSYLPFGKKYVSMAVVGKQSNVQTVRIIAEYVIKLCNELSKQPGTDRSWRNSFKNGFQSRLSQRVTEELRQMQTVIGKDREQTQNAIAIRDLYAISARNNDEWLKAQGINLSTGRSSTYSRNSAGYNAGGQAANNVSLRSSAAKRITH